MVITWHELNELRRSAKISMKIYGCVSENDNNRRRCKLNSNNQVLLDEKPTHPHWDSADVFSGKEYKVDNNHVEWLCSNCGHLSTPAPVGWDENVTPGWMCSLSPQIQSHMTMHTEVPDVVALELIRISPFKWCFNMVQLGPSLKEGLTGCKRHNKLVASHCQWPSCQYMFSMVHVKLPWEVLGRRDESLCCCCQRNDFNIKSLLFKLILACFTPHVPTVSHLLVRSLGHTHHEEEQPCEADSLHCGDEEKGVSLGVQRPHRHLRQLGQRQGAEARRVQLLSQAETEGKQRQGGGHQPTEHKVPHTLLHQLHLSTQDRNIDGRNLFMMQHFAYWYSTYSSSNSAALKTSRATTLQARDWRPNVSGNITFYYLANYLKC